MWKNFYAARLSEMEKRMTEISASLSIPETETIFPPDWAIFSTSQGMVQRELVFSALQQLFYSLQDHFPVLRGVVSFFL